MSFSQLRDLEGTTAILGGSFDPIHNGHLQIAQQVLYWTRVATVLFVPTGNHPFKQNDIRQGFAQRYALVKETIANEPRFAISEVDKNGSGYTAHLVQKLQEANPGIRYVFIIGADNLPQLHEWFDYPWLSKHLHFLVLPRPGFKIDLNLLANLRANLLAIELSPISSSDIKDRIARGISITGLVPEPLEQRIFQLYSTATPK
ncbi:MAG: nicotinate (nicotinamide) nucleotide adenylyltransferase [Candidatus Cloacimonetes bacterium]|nr:nicotinate (nicotinamide) nucleotide adenylyltransferase [Candidatus Cloacimonadota bacterium]